MADKQAVALVDHKPKLSQLERKLKMAILDVYRVSELAPPGSEDLVAIAGARANVIQDMLALLVEEELLVEIGPYTLSRS